MKKKLALLFLVAFIMCSTLVLNNSAVEGNHINSDLPIDETVLY